MRNEKRRQDWIGDILLGLVLIAVTIVAYQKAWHAGYIWDDDVYVTANPLLTAADGLKRIWLTLDSPSQYFPLVYTTFRIEHALWGLNPAGYHWVNISLHAVNGLLVWMLLRTLRIPGAWLAGALFALHPVQVESVAWITERKNVLMGFFFLLTLICWARFIRKEQSGRWWLYAASLVFYALALSSKTTACTIPAALFLMLWLERKPINLGRIMQVTPFVVLGLAAGLVSIWWERFHQGTQGPLFVIGFGERALVATRAIWFYLGKLVWPTDLSFIYPRWPISVTNPAAYIWLGVTVAAVLLIWFLRRYTGRSLEVAFVFFVATLAPVLGFIMLYTFRYSWVADHYQYMACLGPFALFAGTCASMFDFWSKKTRFLQGALCAALLLVLGLLTWRQCGMYADLETLWNTTIARNPRCWLAHNNLGTILMERGQPEAAVAQFRESLRLNPDYENAHYNLGRFLQDSGRPEEAVAEFEKALRIDPNYATAHNSLGNALLDLGRTEEAIAQFHEALRSDPTFALTHNNLGNAMLNLGRTEEAIAQYHEALRINPTLELARNNLRNVLLEQQRTEHEIAQYREILRDNSANAAAQNHLAFLLLQQGQTEEAITHFQKALDLLPDNQEIQNSLAWVLATASQPSLRNGARALELAQKANSASGGTNPIYLRTLAAAYAEVGDFRDAVQTAQSALQMVEAGSNHRGAGNTTSGNQALSVWAPL